MIGRSSRALPALLVIGLIAAPAVVMRIACVGHACDAVANTGRSVPFCGLPEALRAEIAAGFYEGRSPEVLAAGRIVDDRGVAWPSPDVGSKTLLSFSGQGVSAGGHLPSDARLDDVADTAAAILGLERPHPEVRSGAPLAGIASGDVPRLLVTIVLRGVGDESDVAETPALARLLADGATGAALVGSSPLDPAAVVTTIGTGGVPARHGITGRVLRNDAGELVDAWGPEGPVNVIATLGDDLDEARSGAPVIGLAGSETYDRGLIGGHWYPGEDDDLVRLVAPERVSSAAVDLLQEGRFGVDEVPDVMGVVLTGRSASLDAQVGAVVDAARGVAGGAAAFVVVGTGAVVDGGAVRPDDEVVRTVRREVGPVVEAAVAGGLYLDQDELARRRVETGEVVRVVDRADGVIDAFPAFAVAFGRYC